MLGQRRQLARRAAEMHQPQPKALIRAVGAQIVDEQMHGIHAQHLRVRPHAVAVPHRHRLVGDQHNVEEWGWRRRVHLTGGRLRVGRQWRRRDPLRQEKAQRQKGQRHHNYNHEQAATGHLLCKPDDKHTVPLSLRPEQSLPTLKKDAEAASDISRAGELEGSV
jgi:hypothetical protein